MHAGGSGRERYVGALVYEDARAAGIRQTQDAAHEVRERTSAEVFFPDLDVIDARVEVALDGTHQPSRPPAERESVM